MAEQDRSNAEILEGIDLQPRRESWARLSAHSTFIGFLITVAFIGSIVVVIATHFNPVAMAALVVFVVAVITITIIRARDDRPRSAPNNLILTTRIKADLLSELSANNVHVESAQGVVTLRGTVPYADFRDAAEHIARRAGAVRVINELEVADTNPTPKDDYLQGFPGVTTPEGAPEVTPFVSLEENVRAALEADPRVNAHLIDIHVDLGMATLTGRQETIQASQAATEIAAHVPGILGVSNDIEVLPSI